MRKNDDSWIVEFKTHSRNDVMKVCALLAKGIGKETVSKRRIVISLLGQTGNGKSAVTDGLVAAFSDQHSCYKLSSEPLMESFACEAGTRKIEKNFNVGDTKCRMTMISGGLAYRAGRASLKNFVGDAADDLGGLDIINSSVSSSPFSDIFINFSSVSRETGWHRKWVISVNDKNLRTPAMAEAIRHLESFHDHRQMRHRKEALELQVA